MHGVYARDKAYLRGVPKLWKDTVEEHRRDVRAAILDAAWILATQRGVRGVTMALVAEHAGISRATLYKYFRGVDAILLAGHTEHVREHLATLENALSSAATPRDGLERLIDQYAEIAFHRARHGTPDTSALVHTGDRHDQNTLAVERLFTRAAAAAQDAGEVRSDVTAKLLGAYCLHAAEAAATLPARGDVTRLASVIKECLGPGSGSMSPDASH